MEESKFQIENTGLVQGQNIGDHLQVTQYFYGPGSMPAHPALPEHVWLVPYLRNTLFTGRENLLRELHERLSTHQTAMLNQPQAISGLGGVGKTQTAIEYAYRHQVEYRYVLWINASTQETLLTSFLELASLLGLPRKDEQRKMVSEVKAWLTQQEDWLAIFDNADDLALVEGYLPSGGKGHLLLTTRAQVPGVLANNLEVEHLGEGEGMLFLLRRAGVLAPTAPLENALAADREAARAVVQELGGLPLALDQAGAYIEETHCQVASYLRQFRTRQASLLKRRGGTGTQHPEPVATTWSLSFERVEALNPLAGDLLRGLAFLAPDAIPEQMLLEGASKLGPKLRVLAKNPFLLDEAVRTLLRFSLVKRRRDEAILAIHRLVQAVLRSSMEEKVQQTWVARWMRAIARTFPYPGEYSNWSLCQAYLPHVEACTFWIDHWGQEMAEAGTVWYKTGWYLAERAQYAEAIAYDRRAIAIGEKMLGPEHPDLALYLNSLAHLYHEQGKDAEAVELYERTITMGRRTLGLKSSYLGSAISNLALLYSKQSKHAEALELLQDAIAMGEKALGPKHPSLASYLNSLAHLYEEQGKHTETEALLRRAIALEEQTLGPEHRRLGNRFSALAHLYEKQGKHAEAEALYQHAIAITEQVRSPEDPELMSMLGNLASLYVDQGKSSEAVTLLLRAITIGEKALGPDDRRLTSPLNNLAHLYEKQSKHAEAEALYQRAITIGEKVLTPGHHHLTSPLYNLAHLYEKQGKHAEAETLYQRAIAIEKQKPGSDHTDAI